MAAILAAPVCAGARSARIGVLAPNITPSTSIQVFEQALHGAGWVEGQNLHVEARTPTWQDTAAVERAISHLIATRPDVLVVWGTVGALAAKRATDQIPIVFLATGDPIGLGIVPSLARPGANLTGVTAIAALDEFGKRLSILVEAVPAVSRVALLVGPDGRHLLELSRPTLEAASRTLKVGLLEILVEKDDDLPRSVQWAKDQGAQALYVWPSGFMLGAGRRLSELALTSRLPSMHPFLESAFAGGLLSYAASLTEIARRGASYVDRILRGAKAGEMPVEEPNKFELVINLRTARALGVTIPPPLLQRADHVIE